MNQTVFENYTLPAFKTADNKKIAIMLPDAKKKKATTLLSHIIAHEARLQVRKQENS